MDGTQFTPEGAQLAPSQEGFEIKNLDSTFQDSEYQRMIEARKAEGQPSAVLFTDIDNTFYRADKAGVSSEVGSLALKNNIPIIGVTGANFEKVLSRVRSGELPYFSAIAASVGTEIWVLHLDSDGNSEYVKDGDFEKNMLARGFNREAIAKLSDMLIRQQKVENPDWKLDFQDPDLESAYINDPKTKVEPYKVSFHTFASGADQLNQIRKTFAQRFPDRRIVFSEEINHDLATTNGFRKYNIDILAATKSDAVKYIQGQMENDLSAVAGDTGNDADMLMGVGDLAIQVGGARSELAESIETVAETRLGKRSFTKVRQPDGSTKLYYREKGQRLGPESILYVTEVLARAKSLSR